MEINISIESNRHDTVAQGMKCCCHTCVLWWRIENEAAGGCAADNTRVCLRTSELIYSKNWRTGSISLRSALWSPPKLKYSKMIWNKFKKRNLIFIGADLGGDFDGMHHIVPPSFSYMTYPDSNWIAVPNWCLEVSVLRSYCNNKQHGPKGKRPAVPGILYFVYTALRCWTASWHLQSLHNTQHKRAPIERLIIDSSLIFSLLLSPSFVW